MAMQQREKNQMRTEPKAPETAKDAMKEAATKTGETIKGAASTVAQKGSDAASFVREKAEEATANVGRKMESMAETVRNKGPHEGMLGSASSAVASTLESAGRELEERGLGGIAEDITSTIRRHPVPAMLVGIGLGFLIARSLVK